MYQSPRTRRLRNDLAALDRLRLESSVFRFTTQGDPPQQYLILLKGKGLWRDRGKIRILDSHRVEIKLGASYPRTLPEIRWITPIYHPNISEIGMVCLGGYGTHWVPSVQLDELCIMLWDMVRYHNYDIRSPYNRDAALWVASQTTFLFPTDGRPLRDLRAALGRIPPSTTTAGSDSVPKVGANGATKFSSARAHEANYNTQLSWIGQFIETLDRHDRRPIDRRPIDRHARVAPVRQFIERYRRIFRKREVPEPNRLVSSVGAVHPGAQVHAQAMAVEDSIQSDRDDEQADVVLLEPVTTVQPEPEPPPPGAEEIIFID